MSNYLNRTSSPFEKGEWLSKKDAAQMCGVSEEDFEALCTRALDSSDEVKAEGTNGTFTLWLLGEEWDDGVPQFCGHVYLFLNNKKFSVTGTSCWCEIEEADY